MKKKVIITFEWWDENGCDFSQYNEQLEEEAMDRIIHMMKDGYTSGELNSYLAEDCIELSGFWSVTWTTL